DSSPWNFGGTGDHGDRIHIWSDDQVVTGVVIKNNLLEQGKGAPMLGIYLDDNTNALGFRDVVISHNTVIDGTGQGLRLENTSGTVFDNTLTWSGTGDAYHDTPRIQVTGGSHNIEFINNRANVALDASAHDLDFLNQVGTFTKGTGFSAATAATVHVATGNFAAALAAVGLSATGAALPGGMSSAPAAAFAASHALSFAGLDLAGHVAAITLHPLGHIA
ncbi:MAG: right-handed parallel beta-helix repeat-containing protein, partial [Pseudomonadota bacterium]|nr:right-handed parallel beta-helix repeat-containing protein [Pseudomonadota bacterium]